MIDVRAAGGFVVGAGSVVGGRRYRVAHDPPGGPAPLPGWLAELADPPTAAPAGPGPAVAADPGRRLAGLAEAVRCAQPGNRTSMLAWAAFRLAEMITAGTAAAQDVEILVSSAVAAGIRGGEPYARYQVTHILGGA